MAERRSDRQGRPLPGYSRLPGGPRQQEDPFRLPEAQRHRRSQRRQEPERSRGGREDGPRRGLGFFGAVRLMVLGALILIAALSFLQFSKAQARLDALRQEKQRQIEAHEQELGYYVQMRRLSGFDEYIRQYAQEFQVDRSFISAVIARESHYDPRAESQVGARGLMQVMQDTGEWVANRLAVRPYSYELLFDPALNIRFGAWYLSYLSAQFEGDPVMIASAYHAGANNVKLWALKYADDRRRLRLDQIPAEDTRDYVGKVMRAYALFYEYDSTHE